MSYLKGLVDSFSKFFSGVRPTASSDSSPSPAAAFDRTMEGSDAGPSVVSERVVLKLKGYFELAKEEIDKAVRAEEWGLAEDAIAHYRNAQRVMLEAKAARVPTALSSRCFLAAIYLYLLQTKGNRGKRVPYWFCWQ